MFENLLKSEIRKAEKAANAYSGRNDCKVTGYCAKLSNCDFGTWYDVTCEICYNYENRADFDIHISVFMDDRRRSFATVKPW